MIIASVSSSSSWQSSFRFPVVVVVVGSCVIFLTCKNVEKTWKRSRAMLAYSKSASGRVWVEKKGKQVKIIGGLKKTGDSQKASNPCIID